MDFSERELRAFFAVAKAGTLGRAAGLANLAQPSLSRLVQRMETRMGQPLFERTTRGMVPTAAGELLLHHSRHLLADFDQIRLELDALRGLRRGVARVGAVASVMRTLVAQTAADMLAVFPELKIEVREGVNSELRDALERREIDLLIAWGEIDDEAMVCLGRCDYIDSFAVFCAASHPISNAPGLEELFAEKWVMPGYGMSPRVLFEGLAKQMGQAAEVCVEAGSVETMVAIAAASRLLCWLPVPLMADHVRLGGLRQLTVPALQTGRTFSVYCRRSGLIPEAARAFLRFLPLASKATQSG